MSAMSSDKTVLEWRYEPPTYFEAPVSRRSRDYDLAISDGVAMATLCCPKDPVPEPLRQEIESRIHNELLARQLLIHQKYTLHIPTIRQERSDGSRGVTVMMQGVACIAAVGTPDIVVKDAQGRITKDTKAERIAEDKKFIEAIAGAAQKHPLVTQLLESYRAAVDDPKNEFLHLYEIRDALVLHFGTRTEAWTRLGVSQGDWKRFETLTNVEPVHQSRHRGKLHGQLRAATPSELKEARGLARKLIESFARAVK
jgi:hypothetical protein